jgi:predicted transcriptional regulator of viral defense system
MPRSAGKGVPRCDVLVARMAEEAWGVLSLAELRACGLSRHDVEGRCRRGTLHRLHQGVYAVGHRPLTLEATLIAAVKALGPNAVLSHYSAAALWKLVEWDDRLPDVTVPGAGTRRVPGIRVHRPRTLDRRDWRHHEGIPVTTPERTLTDLASACPTSPSAARYGRRWRSAM